jgi:hypothetical protein
MELYFDNNLNHMKELEISKEQDLTNEDKENQPENQVKLPPLEKEESLKEEPAQDTAQIEVENKPLDSNSGEFRPKESPQESLVS